MLRKIVKYGNPVLEQMCEPVAEEEFGGDELRSLVSDMFETMYHAHGVGLAAPQVGVLKRLTVIDCSGGEGEGPASRLDQSRNPGQRGHAGRPRRLPVDSGLYRKRQPTDDSPHPLSHCRRRMERVGG